MMTNNSIDDILSEVEKKEIGKCKSKKKKPKTKKSDHKHCYDRIILREEKSRVSDLTHFTFYKQCTICSKEEWIKIPEKVDKFLKETNSRYDFFYWLTLNKDDLEKIEKEFPEITVVYLER